MLAAKINLGLTQLVEFLRCNASTWNSEWRNRGITFPIVTWCFGSKSSSALSTPPTVIVQGGDFFFGSATNNRRKHFFSPLPSGVKNLENDHLSVFCLQNPCGEYFNGPKAVNLSIVDGPVRSFLWASQVVNSFGKTYHNYGPVLPPNNCNLESRSNFIHNSE
jgi:hypothetical protein